MAQGVKGILDAYRSTLPYIKQSGPTYFAPILEAFTHHCQSHINKQQYNVLLIITDGVIHDMTKTKQCLANLSTMPCSVVIIGVGEEDFENMIELDGDGPDKLPGSARDIVQFVEFNKAAAKGDLNEQVLHEIPDQFMSFVKLHNI